MTPIMYGLQEIKNNIPPQILNRFYIPQRYYQLRRDPFMVNTSDEQIIDKVINRRVRLDCDTAGATEIDIELSGLKIEPLDKDKYLIHVPKDRTNGREITSVMAIVLFGMASTGISPQAVQAGMMSMSSTSPLGTTGTCPNMGVFKGLMSANQPLSVTETTNCRVVDGQTILVEDLITPLPTGYIRCVLANDREFSTLARPAWKQFGKLCVLACKADIYTRFIISIDTAEIIGGHEIGRFKEIVESYSDANEQYDEYFHTTWRKVQYMADNRRYTNHLKALVGRFK